MSSPLVSDSVYWVDVEKIKPNPYQPRREFDPMALESLSDSIRQYGVLQPLVVTRREIHKDDGGIVTEYELIAGERRLRASKLAGIAQVPVVIRTGEDNNLMKLELAIIENLQREDLNPVDRAKAFQQFVDEFGYKHAEIAKKVGKSREYVSNSLRLLSLPDEILSALIAGKITEGHARPIMMLKDKPEERDTLFKEIMFKKLTVRDAEGIARRIALDKVRKRTRDFDPEILQMEKELTEQLGTRVHIEPREVGGKITIDFFSDDDLKNLLAFMNAQENRQVKTTLVDEMQRSAQESVESLTTNIVAPLSIAEVVADAVVEHVESEPIAEVEMPIAPEFVLEVLPQEEVEEKKPEELHSESPVSQPVLVAMPTPNHHTMPVPTRPDFVPPQDPAHTSHEIQKMVEPRFQSAPVGVVPFGGSDRINDHRGGTLGDVLRNVLKDKQSNMYTPPVQPSSAQTQAPKPIVDDQKKETMVDMVQMPTHNTVVPTPSVPRTLVEEMELPDTGIFRDEVNTILGNNNDSSSEAVYDSAVHAIDQEQESDPLSASMLGSVEELFGSDIPTPPKPNKSDDDDIYSIRNFAV